ncbi:MAG: hypothetical protein ABI769_11875 [Pseudomonadota bacterium]
MKAPANYSTSRGTVAQRGWLPAAAATPRTLDLAHWQSRAARGHTWNSGAALKRRGNA